MLLIVLGVYANPASAFPDTQDLWFRHSEAINYLQQKGAIGGYPDGTYKPHQPINRAEFLKIVFKGRSDVQPVGRRCFSDVNPDQWYAPYVCAAARRGIVDGYPNGTFQPGQTINTAEAIKIVLNAYEQNITEGTGEQWYAPYVQFLDENDILGEHSYLPWVELDRLHAADLLWRLLRYEEEQIIPRFSDGCGKAKPAVKNSMNVNGEQRNFLLTVPSAYVVHDPVPLVLAFHGRTSNYEAVRSYYKFDREMHDAIIVYPAARQNGNGAHVYEQAEIDFFDALVEDLSKKYCIDMDRIYLAGHSLGGWFANKIACLRGNVVRASASVGTSGFIGECTGPAAALLIHNPADRLASFSGSERIREERIVENGCNWQTEPVTPREFNCIQHQACTANPVTFCPHELDTDSRGQYYPHHWPRNTAQHMWNFFRNIQ